MSVNNPQSREALVQAVAEKSPVSSSPAQLEAQKIRDEVKASKNPRPILERLQIPQQADIRNADKAIANNIGTEVIINATTGMPEKVLTTDETARHDEAKGLENLAQRYDKLGFAGITNTGEKNALRQFMNQAVNSFPELNSYLDGIGPVGDPNRQAKIDEWLNDPDVKNRVLPKLIEQATSTTLPDTLTTLKRRLNEKFAAESVAHDAFKKNEDRRREVGNELSKFENDATTPLGDSLKKLTAEDRTQIHTKLAPLHDDLADLNSDLAMIQQQFDAALRMKNQVDATKFRDELKEKKIEVRNKEKEIMATSQPLRDEQEMIAKQKQLQEEQKQLEAADPELLKTEENARIDRLQVQTDLALAKQKRAEDEEEYVSGLVKSMSEAMADHFSDEFAIHAQAQITVLENEAKAEPDTARKAVKEGLVRRYKKVDTEVKTRFGKKETKVKITFDKEKISREYGQVLKAGNPDAIVRSMLDTANANLPVGDPNRVDVDKLMKDADFLKDARGQVAEQLFADKFQTGKITDDEASLIFDTEWGSDALTKAIKHNAKLEGEVKSLQEQGLIKDTPDLIAKLRKHGPIAGLGLAAILALFFMPAIVGGVGLASAAGIELGMAR